MKIVKRVNCYKSTIFVVQDDTGKYLLLGRYPVAERIEAGDITNATVVHAKSGRIHIRLKDKSVEVIDTNLSGDAFRHLWLKKNERWYAREWGFLEELASCHDRGKGLLKVACVYHFQDKCCYFLRGTGRLVATVSEENLNYYWSEGYVWNIKETLLKASDGNHFKFTNEDSIKHFYIDSEVRFDGKDREGRIMSGVGMSYIG